MSNLLEAKGIKKHYVDGPRVLEVLNGIDLEVRAGTAVSVVGASGTGKSTLLHLLGALDRPTGGEVILQGKKYSALKEKDLATLRSTCIGFVFQFHHLLGEFSALENVMVPAMIQGSSKEEAARHSKEILQAVGLGERLGHRPVKLSGGEQQRVALARALVNSPDIILADEPTGDLDLSTGEEMIRLIWKKTVEQGKALVIVTHDPDIAVKADRMYRLKEGTLHVEKA